MSTESISRLSEAEAAVLLHVAPGTLRNWRHRSCGPKYIKYGRVIAYRVEDLEAFLADCTIKPAFLKAPLRPRSAT
ncbi:MAG: helix-turn-helix domain-containing protein [Desulfovibrionaceae bacterium]|nr:helix-turn-helix domain-containing protein [Desulfovibrionaceae bacterium]